MTLPDDSARRLTAARATLLLDSPFFGALALRLTLRIDNACSTAWTDGTTLGYNPAWCATLSRAELTALLAHEVMHCAAGHPWRRDARELQRWNEACDRAINPVLRDAGFQLQDGALYELPDSPAGASAEWVYAHLDQRLEETTSPGQKHPGVFGEVRDAPTETMETEAAWKTATQQAAFVARGQGSLPGSLERFAANAVQARVDWRSVLRRFVQETCCADYTWRMPNVRYLAGGLYLPSLRSEELGPLLVAVDTSGSIDAALLSMFQTELKSLVSETQPRCIYAVACDAAIQHVAKFELLDEIELPTHGGGGTDFRPIFTALEEQPAWLDTAPIGVVYLTDLRGRFPTEAPECPTLWVTPEACTAQAPFGEVIHVHGG